MKTTDESKVKVDESKPMEVDAPHTPSQVGDTPSPSSPADVATSPPPEPKMDANSADSMQIDRDVTAEPSPSPSVVSNTTESSLDSNSTSSSTNSSSTTSSSSSNSSSTNSSSTNSSSSADSSVSNDESSVRIVPIQEGGGDETGEGATEGKEGGKSGGKSAPKKKSTTEVDDEKYGQDEKIDGEDAQEEAEAEEQQEGKSNDAVLAAKEKAEKLAAAKKLKKSSPSTPPTPRRGKTRTESQRDAIAEVAIANDESTRLHDLFSIEESVKERSLDDHIRHNLATMHHLSSNLVHPHSDHFDKKCPGRQVFDQTGTKVPLFISKPSIGFCVAVRSSEDDPKSFPSAEAAKVDLAPVVKMLAVPNLSCMPHAIKSALDNEPTYHGRACKETLEKVAAYRKEVADWMNSIITNRASVKCKPVHDVYMQPMPKDEKEKKKVIAELKKQSARISGEGPLTQDFSHTVAIKEDRIVSENRYISMQPDDGAFSASTGDWDAMGGLMSSDKALIFTPHGTVGGVYPWGVREKNGCNRISYLLMSRMGRGLAHAEALYHAPAELLQLVNSPQSSIDPVMHYPVAYIAHQPLYLVPFLQRTPSAGSAESSFLHVRDGCVVEFKEDIAVDEVKDGDSVVKPVAEEAKSRHLILATLVKLSSTRYPNSCKSIKEQQEKAAIGAGEVDDEELKRLNKSLDAIKKVHDYVSEHMSEKPPNDARHVTPILSPVATVIVAGPIPAKCQTRADIQKWLDTGVDPKLVHAQLFDDIAIVHRLSDEFEKSAGFVSEERIVDADPRLKEFKVEKVDAVKPFNYHHALNSQVIQVIRGLGLDKFAMDDSGVEKPLDEMVDGWFDWVTRDASDRYYHFELLDLLREVFQSEHNFESWLKPRAKLIVGERKIRDKSKSKETHIILNEDGHLLFGDGVPDDTVHAIITDANLANDLQLQEERSASDPSSSRKKDKKKKRASQRATRSASPPTVEDDDANDEDFELKKKDKKPKSTKSDKKPPKSTKPDKKLTPELKSTPPDKSAKSESKLKSDTKLKSESKSKGGNKKPPNMFVAPVWSASTSDSQVNNLYREALIAHLRQLGREPVVTGTTLYGRMRSLMKDHAKPHCYFAPLYNYLVKSSKDVSNQSTFYQQAMKLIVQNDLQSYALAMLSKETGDWIEAMSTPNHPWRKEFPYSTLPPNDRSVRIYLTPQQIISFRDELLYYETTSEEEAEEDVQLDIDITKEGDDEGEPDGENEQGEVDDGGQEVGNDDSGEEEAENDDDEGELPPIVTPKSKRNLQMMTDTAAREEWKKQDEVSVIATPRAAPKKSTVTAPMKSNVTAPTKSNVTALRPATTPYRGYLATAAAKTPAATSAKSATSAKAKLAFSNGENDDEGENEVEKKDEDDDDDAMEDDTENSPNVANQPVASNKRKTSPIQTLPQSKRSKSVTLNDVMRLIEASRKTTIDALKATFQQHQQSLVPQQSQPMEIATDGALQRSQSRASRLSHSSNATQPMELMQQQSPASIQQSRSRDASPVLATTLSRRSDPSHPSDSSYHPSESSQQLNQMPINRRQGYISMMDYRTDEMLMQQQLATSNLIGYRKGFMERGYMMYYGSY